MEATIDESAYDPVFAEGLASFFRTALRRSASERYPTGEEMLRAWRSAFEAASAGEGEGEPALDSAVAAARASLDDPLVGLGVSGRAVALLGRLGAETVRSTLGLAIVDVNRATGASHATKREASALVAALQDRFAEEQQVLAGVRDEALSIDLIADRLVPQGPDQAQQRFCAALLGLDEPTLEDQRERDAWTPSEEVAARLGLAEQTGALETARGRWQRMKALTALRADVEAALAGEGGVMTVGELGSSLLTRRGSSGDPAHRSGWRRPWHGRVSRPKPAGRSSVSSSIRTPAHHSSRFRPRLMALRSTGSRAPSTRLSSARPLIVSRPPSRLRPPVEPSTNCAR